MDFARRKHTASICVMYHKGFSMNTVLFHKHFIIHDTYLNMLIFYAYIPVTVTLIILLSVAGWPSHR